MAACPSCAAEAPDNARFCPACGTALGAPAKPAGSISSSIFAHIPHPHIHLRRQAGPRATREHLPAARGAIGRINNFLAVRITDLVGTMWCAYAFAALALVSLPDAIRGGTGALVSWTAQTFIQLVLLSIIIVGQKVASEASDKRAIDTFNDAEAILHESVQIQRHLAAQDAVLQRLIGTLRDVDPDAEASEPPSTGPRGAAGDLPA